jgi:hypothetical protein
LAGIIKESGPSGWIERERCVYQVFNHLLALLLSHFVAIAAGRAISHLFSSTQRLSALKERFHDEA